MRSKRVRASWSFLNMWSTGQVNSALISYFHVPHETPLNYVNGKQWDAYCQVHIKKHGSLPPEWGGEKLKAPKVQLRLEAPYNAICDLVGVLDIYDNKIIYELKSGHSASSRQYAGTQQIPIYYLLAKLNSLPVKGARVIRYNPKTDKQDRAEILPSRQIIERAENYINSIVPEIHQYFLDNNLFNETDASMAKKLQK